MATTTSPTLQNQGISTLDVLWAFYQSQPVRVRKAFRNRLEAQEKDRKETFPWQHDLKEIRTLKDGWDGANAPRINRVSITHIVKLMSKASISVARSVRLYPTHLGAVMLKQETPKGRINCEMGDTQMSYFVKRPGETTLHHSFEVPDSEHFAQLCTYLESLI